MALALQALGRKERSERELAEWLRERGVAELEVEDVVSCLIESGGLDDAHFADRFAADKRELAGWGPDRIRAALAARGVGSAEIEAALAVEDEQSQLERALSTLAERGLECDSERERARALALLGRRGFGLELAYEAVRRTESHSSWGEATG
jgi:regulatory protein